jgi:hypothetical protein
MEKNAFGMQVKWKFPLFSFKNIGPLKVYTRLELNEVHINRRSKIKMSITNLIEQKQFLWFLLERELLEYPFAVTLIIFGTLQFLAIRQCFVQTPICYNNKTKFQYIAQETHSTEFHRVSAEHRHCQFAFIIPITSHNPMNMHCSAILGYR